MRSPRGIHRSTTSVMSLVMMVIGVALIVRTLTLGGGPTATGILLGVAFVAVGVGRLYIQSRTR